MTTLSNMTAEISSNDTHPRKRVAVLDTEMSYVDTGRGDPIVFLHGNPTSSYLWRNIIPYVIDYGRCLAPDLVGMGQSGKSPTKAYRFVDHARYVDEWLDILKLTSSVTLVVHDWGSALGFYRIMRFPDQIKAIAYMEAIAKPQHWEDFGEAAEVFRGLRSPRGEQLIFEQNIFVEGVLPRAVLRKLSDREMAAYRQPFLEREARLTTLVWPRQIPLDGEPADVTGICEAYGKTMAQSPIPKLLIIGQPGAIVRGGTLDFCRTWPNQKEITVKGIHFLQEDSPHEIGMALQDFMRSLNCSPGQGMKSTRGA
jgi:haloalkane dehalogenase